MRSPWKALLAPSGPGHLGGGVALSYLACSLQPPGAPSASVCRWQVAFCPPAGSRGAQPEEVDTQRLLLCPRGPVAVSGGPVLRSPSAGSHLPAALSLLGRLPSSSRRGSAVCVLLDGNPNQQAHDSISIGTQLLQGPHEGHSGGLLPQPALKTRIQGDTPALSWQQTGPCPGSRPRAGAFTWEGILLLVLRAGRGILGTPSAALVPASHSPEPHTPARRTAASVPGRSSGLSLPCSQSRPRHSALPTAKPCSHQEGQHTPRIAPQH